MTPGTGRDLIFLLLGSLFGFFRNRFPVLFFLLVLIFIFDSFLKVLEKECSKERSQDDVAHDHSHQEKAIGKRNVERPMLFSRPDEDGRDLVPIVADEKSKSTQDRRANLIEVSDRAV